jgi:hypothetical protein
MSARVAFDILFDRQHRASPFWMQVTGGAAAATNID